MKHLWQIAAAAAATAIEFGSAMLRRQQTATDSMHQDMHVCCSGLTAVLVSSIQLHVMLMQNGIFSITCVSLLLLYVLESALDTLRELRM